MRTSNEYTMWQNGRIVEIFNYDDNGDPGEAMETLACWCAASCEFDESISMTRLSSAHNWHARKLHPNGKQGGTVAVFDLFCESRTVYKVSAGFGEAVAVDMLPDGGYRMTAAALALVDYGVFENALPFDAKILEKF